MKLQLIITITIIICAKVKRHTGCVCVVVLQATCCFVCVQLHIVAAIFLHNDGETKKLIIGQDVNVWFLFVLGTYPQESMRLHNPHHSIQ